MRLFVTGAAGFGGSAFTRLALAAGHEVTALVRHPSGAERLEGLGIRCHLGDVARSEGLPEAMRGHDAVVHFAAWQELGVPRRRLHEMYEVVVTGTVNVLTSAKRAEVPRVFHCSSAQAWFGRTSGQVATEGFVRKDRPSTPAARTSAIAHERALEAARSGFPVTIIMPAAAYGPGDRSLTEPLLRHYLRGRLRVVPGGEAGFSWVHVEDLARGALQALGRGQPGESYILGGDNLTVRELFSVLERLSGVPAPRFVPAAPVYLLRPLARLPVSLGPVPLAVVTDWVRSLGTYLFSSEKARRELGYEPRSAEVGFKETLEAVRQELEEPREEGGDP